MSVGIEKEDKTSVFEKCQSCGWFVRAHCSAELLQQVHAAVMILQSLPVSSRQISNCHDEQNVRMQNYCKRWSRGVFPDFPIDLCGPCPCLAPLCGWHIRCGDFSGNLVPCSCMSSLCVIIDVSQDCHVYQLVSLSIHSCPTFSLYTAPLYSPYYVSIFQPLSTLSRRHNGQVWHPTSQHSLALSFFHVS